jgi:hypothetical protein
MYLSPLVRPYAAELLRTSEQKHIATQVDVVSELVNDTNTDGVPCSSTHLLPYVEQSKWSTIAAFPWNNSEHINILELRMVMLGTRTVKKNSMENEICCNEIATK